MSENICLQTQHEENAAEVLVPINIQSRIIFVRARLM